MVIKDIAIKAPGSKASFSTYFLETPQGALAYEKPLVIVVPGGGPGHIVDEIQVWLQLFQTWFSSLSL